MSIYKINFKQIRLQPDISEMLSALERGFSEFEIDYYLVGAVARDVWMSGINKIHARRTTADIDFAVLINDKGRYENLKTYLVQYEGFHPTRENAFVLLWKDKTEVDLMPFGAIEDENGKVTVDGTGYTSLEVPGFKEVYQEGLPEINIEEQHQFKFCTLPGIVILKLIAWEDRPEVRRDDIKDICDILNHFFDMYDEEIYNHHNELFEDESVELIHIAARVMGREMKKIASRSERLYQRLSRLLQVNTEKASESEMGKIMTEYFANTVTENVALLLTVKEGFTE